MTQGSLARGTGKLDAFAVSARPRGPSALPGNHEIVSEGYELSPHAISSWRSHLRPAPATRANSGRSLADAEQTIRGFFVASSLLVSTVSVVPYSHARENAPSLTQLFVSKPQSDFLVFETR